MNARPWRGAFVAAAAVGVVEVARRAGVSVPDVTPIYLLAVVYAALDGGFWPGLASVVITFAHALFTAGGAAPSLYALAVVAPVTVALATLLERETPTSEGEVLPALVEEDIDTDEPAEGDGFATAFGGEDLAFAGDTVKVEREPDTLAFTAMSPNAERVLGVSAELAIANADFWTSGLHPADRPRVQAAYDALKTTPADCTLTYQVLSADAGFIRVRETLHPHRVLPGGRVLKLVGAITRLREGEAREAEIPAPAPAAPPQTAASGGVAGDDILSRVAAELEAPLDVLTGWARVLRGEPDAPTRARAADVIERAASAQARALEPLLRGASPRPRLVDIALVVHAALARTRPAAHARGIGVAWSLDPAIDLLYGDADRLEQIVGTLLGNTIGLAPDGARIHAAIEQAGSLVRLTVSDTATPDAPKFSVTLPVTARE